MNKCSQCERERIGGTGSICGQCMGPPCIAANYVAVLEAAVTTGWPVGFKTDLLCHDKRVLSTRPGNRPFLWCVRESGTYLVLPEKGRIARNSEVLDDDHKLFWWDGKGALTEVSRGRALDLIGLASLDGAMMPTGAV